MAVREVLLLGNPKLFEASRTILKEEVCELKETITDLHDTLLDFSMRMGCGRAIAAPQLGVMIRLIYMHINEPVIFINPKLIDKSKEIIELWDDCLSFPDLLVKVKRHKSCRICFKDLEWNDRELFLENDLSELLQHECDHLDGILAVSRAINENSFCLKSQKHLIT